MMTEDDRIRIAADWERVLQAANQLDANLFKDFLEVAKKNDILPPAGKAYALVRNNVSLHLFEHNKKKGKFLVLDDCGLVQWETANQEEARDLLNKWKGGYLLTVEPWCEAVPEDEIPDWYACPLVKEWPETVEEDPDVIEYEKSIFEGLAIQSLQAEPEPFKTAEIAPETKMAAPKPEPETCSGCDGQGGKDTAHSYGWDPCAICKGTGVKPPIPKLKRFTRLDLDEK
jgi:hypothetical protein